MFQSRVRRLAAVGAGLLVGLSLPLSAAATQTYYQARAVGEQTNRVWTATGGVGGKVVYAVANGSSTQQWEAVPATGRPAGQVNYINRASGLCLDVDKSGAYGALTVGAQIIQEVCTGSLSQVWEYETDFDPWFAQAYAVENQFSLYDVSVKDASKANNAPLVQDEQSGPWGGGMHQYWRLTPVA